LNIQPKIRSQRYSNPLFFVVLNCAGITLESSHGYTQASRDGQ